MMQATFTISATELTAELLEKIKSLFQGKELEMVISVKPKETQETARRRIDQSIRHAEQNLNMVTFSPEEYEALVQQLSRQ